MKNKRPCPGRLAVCIAVVSMILAATGAAQEKPVPKRYSQQGVLEIGGSAMFNYSVPVVNGETGTSTWQILATPCVGYFVIDGLQVGAEPLGIGIVHAGGATQTELRFLGAVAYHLRVNRYIYPYVQGLAGYTASIESGGGTQTTVSGFSWGGRLGAKFPVADRGIVSVGVHYLLITTDPAGAQKRNGVNELAATVGFAIWF